MEDIHTDSSPQFNIKDMFNSYLSSEIALSLTSIQSITNIDRRTLKRIKTEEGYDLTNIEPSKLLKFFQLIKKDISDSDLTKLLDNKTLEHLSKSYEILLSNFVSSTVVDSIEKNSPEKNDDPDQFLCTLLASNINGTNLIEVKDILGELGVLALKELLLQGTLEENSIGQIHTKTDTIILSNSTIQKHTPTLLRFYKLAHSGQKRKYNFQVTASVNSEGLAEIHDAFRELHNKITIIQNDSKKSGPIQYFGLGVMDSFVNDINSEKSEILQ